jgi:hypothetical protein
MRWIAIGLVLAAAASAAAADRPYHWVTNWVTVTGCKAVTHGPGPIGSDESLCNQYRLVRALRPLLAARGAAARIEYASPCQGADALAVPFPPVPLRADPKADVAALFAPEAHAVVTDLGDGIIRIRIGEPPSDVLRTPLGALRFDAEARFNPQGAMAVIAHDPKLDTAMRRLGLAQPMAFEDHLIAPPLASLPHLPRTIHGSTYGSALDAIARTFHGIVFVGIDACRPRRGLYDDFAYGQDAVEQLLPAQRDPD